MKISELFLHVQIQVVTYLWCQVNPSITGLVLMLVLSAPSQGYAVFRRYLHAQVILFSDWLIDSYVYRL